MYHADMRRITPLLMAMGLITSGLQGQTPNERIAALEARVATLEASVQALQSAETQSAISNEADSAMAGGRSGALGTREVEFVQSKVERLPADYGRSAKPYSAHVRAYFQFRNNHTIEMTGVEYQVVFRDAFGDVLYQTELRFQSRLQPNEVSEMDRYWYWEDNAFVDEEPYDHLQAAASAGTIKVEVTLKRAVFADGSIINW